MRLFDLFQTVDIDRGVQEYRTIPGAVLLDVRTPGEYRAGHIPGSINIPLQTIERVTEAVARKDTPLYVHCQSGGRSRQAAALLRQMGYTDVRDIGGISNYSGKVER